MPEPKEPTGQPAFWTPSAWGKQQLGTRVSPRGRLLVASCRAGSYLARRMVDRYHELLRMHGSPSHVPYLEAIDSQFSDTETCVRLDVHVEGADVFLFQALADPRSGRSVDQNYMAFLIAARAAYARQLQPTRFQREPTTARLMADMSREAGMTRLVTWHPHSAHIRGFYGTLPVDTLDAAAFFVNQFQRFAGRNEVVVVAPDAGASKPVTQVARALGLRSAIASKVRPRPEEARVSEIVGDLSGRRVTIVLANVISSGGTAYAAIRELADTTDIAEVYVGASHDLCLEPALRRLNTLHANCGLQEVIVTNSIPPTPSVEALPFLTIRCLSNTLAHVINCIHYQQSVSEYFSPSQRP
jgi:ribose-phosphate pyrophosphokinase